PAPDTAWPILSDALTRALDELVARRTAEGEALGAELQKLTADLRAQTDLVEARVPAAVARREARLRERIRALLGEAPIDQARILGEVAIWAEKTDVREELTRLRAVRGGQDDAVPRDAAAPARPRVFRVGDDAGATGGRD